MTNAEIAARLDALTQQVQQLTNMVCESLAHARGQRDAAVYGPNGQYGESQQEYLGYGRGGR
jgi:hypothetical protein